MITPQLIILIISHVFVHSSAESLYSQACSSGDPPVACQRFCELCQTGCLPPGKTLATKTFYDVCDEEQQLKFDTEQKEKMKICQEYISGLAGSTDEDNMAVDINSNNINNKFTTTENFVSKILFLIKNLDSNSVQTAIICILAISVATNSSRLRTMNRRLSEIERNRKDERTILEDLLKREEQNEKERKEAENTRLAKEIERQNAENDRKNAENDRKNAESARETAEGARQTTEKGRDDAEKTRQDEETEREAAENTRRAKETKRETAEDTRQTNETQRNDAESARQNQEIERQNAENERKGAESTRETSEGTRQKNENVRDDAEKTCQVKEKERQDAETASLDKEKKREAAEDARQKNETQCNNAESARQDQEKAREELPNHPSNNQITVATNQTSEAQVNNNEESKDESSEGQNLSSATSALEISFKSFEGASQCKFKTINTTGNWLSMKPNKMLTDDALDQIKKFLKADEAAKKPKGFYHFKLPDSELGKCKNKSLYIRQKVDEK